MKRIYLSGSMTNMLDLYLPLFHSTAASLRAAGHSVISLAEINPDPGTWRECMRRDIKALMDATPWPPCPAGGNPRRQQ